MVKREFKICSLFAGCGGLDLGFELAKHPKLKFKAIWANDIYKCCAKTHERNFTKSEFICGDIWDYDLKKMPDCDVILGGFPCQDFSVLRGDEKRKGVETKRGNLYLKFVEAVELKKPIMFIAENVKGILSANKGNAIKRIVSDFTKAGYHVHYKLIKFVEYGVPQTRERVFIVGIREDLDGDFEFPKPTHLNNPISSEEALRGVKKIVANNEKHNIRDSTIDKISRISPGGNYKDLSEYKNNNWMSLIYRRLHPKRPSSTIVALGGGGTLGYHYSEPRPLTNRERARIQTFPDDFIFEGTQREVRMQIGNAVPPLGAKAVAEALLKHISERLNLIS